MTIPASNGLGNGATSGNPVVVETEHGPRIAGTRITIYDVYYYLVKGRSAERIAEILPLKLEQVHAVIEYIHGHKEAVHAVHERIEERFARGNPPEIQAKLDKIRAELAPFWAERRRALAAEKGDEGNHSRREH